MLHMAWRTACTYLPLRYLSLVAEIWREQVVQSVLSRTGPEDSPVSMSQRESRTVQEITPRRAGKIIELRADEGNL